MAPGAARRREHTCSTPVRLTAGMPGTDGLLEQAASLCPVLPNMMYQFALLPTMHWCVMMDQFSWQAQSSRTTTLYTSPLCMHLRMIATYSEMLKRGYPADCSVRRGAGEHPRSPAGGAERWCPVQFPRSDLRRRAHRLLGNEEDRRHARPFLPVLDDSQQVRSPP